MLTHARWISNITLTLNNFRAPLPKASSRLRPPTAAFRRSPVPPPMRNVRTDAHAGVYGIIPARLGALPLPLTPCLLRLKHPNAVALPAAGLIACNRSSLVCVHAGNVAAFNTRLPRLRLLAVAASILAATAAKHKADNYSRLFQRLLLR